MWPFDKAFPEKGPQDVDGKEFDYVVVGGGTAGAALASKLSEDPSVSVLLIERGPVADTWISRVPLISSDYNMDGSPTITDHRSMPVAARGGYGLFLLSTHLLGGASRINASIVTRGMAGGYNDWAESCGLTDWSWDKVEPYFKSLETTIEAKSDPSRGDSGPVSVRHQRHSQQFPSYLEKTYETLGLAVRASANSSSTPAQHFSKTEMAVTKDGHRESSYSAFMNARIANQRKGHLTVCTRTAVTKLAVSADGTTVTGVHFRRARQKGEKSAPDYFVKVRREAIVCGGVFVSPLILLHSGIGPPEVLAKHGIPCVRDLPVGRNYKDHMLFGFTMEVPQSESIHALQNSVLIALWHFLLYIFLGAGVFAANPTPGAAWVKTAHLDEKTMVMKARDEDGNDTSDPSSPRNIPDLEVMSLSCTCLDRNVPGKNIISMLPCLTQPESSGTVELASSDPEDLAKVDFPYYTDKRDLITARKAARFTMRVMDEFINNSEYPHKASILTAPSINRLPANWEKTTTGLAKKLMPVPHPSGRAQPPTASTQAFIPRYEVEKTWDTVTDEEIDAYVLAVSTPGYHGASSCRMSLDPKDGVVDQRFKVHGMTNLRVADASALPKLPTAHTMLPVMMLGVRCADFIRED